MARNPLTALAVGGALLLTAFGPGLAADGAFIVAQSRDKDPHIEVVRKSIRRHERDLDRLMPGEKSAARSLLYRIRSSERRLNRSDNTNDKRFIESERRLEELEEDVQRWIRVYGDR